MASLTSWKRILSEVSEETFKTQPIALQTTLKEVFRTSTTCNPQQLGNLRQCFHTNQPNMGHEILIFIKFCLILSSQLSSRLKSFIIRLALKQTWKSCFHLVILKLAGLVRDLDCCCRSSSVDRKLVS